MARLVTREEQQRLLLDARSRRDIFAQEKARVENLLDLAIEKVKFYKALLGTTESKLCSAEDLIGNIRFRLQQRGVQSHCLVPTMPLPPSETAPAVGNPASEKHAGMCHASSCWS